MVFSFSTGPRLPLEFSLRKKPFHKSILPSFCNLRNQTVYSLLFYLVFHSFLYQAFFLANKSFRALILCLLCNVEFCSERIFCQCSLVLSQKSLEFFQQKDDYHSKLITSAEAMREQAKVYATLALLIMGILIFNILSPKGAANAGHHAEAILKLNGFAQCIPILSR